MSSLNTAVSLIEGHIVPMLITKHLNFHVSGVDHKLLKKHNLITEALHGLSLGAVQLSVKVLGCGADSHAFSTTSPHCLDHHWVTNLFSFRAEKLHLLVFTMVTSNDRDIGINHDLLAC